ncbi:MAG TPA: FtsX-like permease family protein [Candidatus Eisenbacteria bacterium]|jgi:ABC-type lipoprotein release transport system permease subunit
MPGSSTLRIAWRNLWRNRRRTALALAAIGLSQALVLFYGGILRGYADWMLQTITGPMLGHAQAHAPGWRKDRAMDETLPHVAKSVAAVGRLPGVAGVSARIYAPSLAAKGPQGYAVMVLGLTPAAESGRAGLLASASTVLSGNRVVVGSALASLMGLAAGDTLAVIGQGADGTLANDLYVVSGAITTPVDLVNRMGVLMDLTEAQSLFGMPDEAHEIVIRARRADEAASVAAGVAALPELRGAEVRDWKQIAPEMLSLIDIVEVSWRFVLVLVFIAAAAGVANTMLMATFERVRELGMLLALGARPARIVRMVVMESLVLGVTGALLGTGLGILIVAVTHRTGVDFAALVSGSPSDVAFMGMNMSMTVFPSLAPDHVVEGFLAVAVTSIVASIWPAARAARLAPARAMRG